MLMCTVSRAESQTDCPFISLTFLQEIWLSKAKNLYLKKQPLVSRMSALMKIIPLCKIMTLQKWRNIFEQLH